MDSVSAITELCRISSSVKSQLRELKMFILALKVLKAQRLAQGLGFKKDLVVVIQNQSTRSDLITL